MCIPPTILPLDISNYVFVVQYDYRAARGRLLENISVGFVIDRHHQSSENRGNQIVLSGLARATQLKSAKCSQKHFLPGVLHLLYQLMLAR